MSTVLPARPRPAAGGRPSADRRPGAPTRLAESNTLAVPAPAAGPPAG
ncbi:hypothetical protein [Cellulomonas endometrii]|nr:hypothetical protein [Cellulomonas endometrii]